MTPENQIVCQTKINTKRDLLEYASDNGNHYFSKGTMRWFNSRLLNGVIQRNGIVYFLTSEKFESHLYERHIVEPRKYTIRKLELNAGERASFDNVGEFQEYRTAREARRYLFDYLDFLDASQTN
jgi:hypothetical protein